MSQVLSMETTPVRTPVIVPIDTPTLGDRSYLAHNGLVGIVVDPQRDIDRLVALAERERVPITHVFETHIHNDYLTGGLALARATGAPYFVNVGGWSSERDDGDPGARRDWPSS